MSGSNAVGHSRNDGTVTGVAVATAATSEVVGAAVDGFTSASGWVAATLVGTGDTSGSDSTLAAVASAGAELPTVTSGATAAAALAVDATGTSADAAAPPLRDPVSGVGCRRLRLSRPSWDFADLTFALAPTVLPPTVDPLTDEVGRSVLACDVGPPPVDARAEGDPTDSSDEVALESRADGVGPSPCDAGTREERRANPERHCQSPDPTHTRRCPHGFCLQLQGLSRTRFAKVAFTSRWLAVRLDRRAATPNGN